MIQPKSGVSHAISIGIDWYLHIVYDCMALCCSQAMHLLRRRPLPAHGREGPRYFGHRTA